MNPFLDFVKGLEDGLAAARTLSVSGRRQAPLESDACVLLFSPHPDDECITGTLPLRLMREAGKRIVNVPVTFGSRKERRAERAAELEKACAFLGWEVFHG